MERLSRRALASIILAFALSHCGNHTGAKSTLTPEGQPCQTDAECATDLCQALPGQTSAVCRRGCNAGCNIDEQCESMGTLSDPRFTCVPAKSALCNACQTSADCPYAGDICYQLGNDTVCGQDCSNDPNACPTGYVCADRTALLSTVPRRQCVPISGTCDCTPTSAGQTRACQVMNNFGTCTGTETCDAKEGWIGCTARTPAQEICDGIDNDCNGLTDGKDPNLLITPCELQQGICAGSKHALADCQGDAGWKACGASDYGPDYEPTPEKACDFKDNDCNGVVDDGMAAGNINECGSKTTVCAVANGTPACNAMCTCVIQSCNTGFSDCDQKYDSGCEANLSNDPNNCNACGNVCAFQGGVPACVNSACVLSMCQPNYWDIDGDPTNDCEYYCVYQSATDAPDYNGTDAGFVDQNCDGIDGDLTKAIFVDTLTGNDANGGTMSSPMQTISAAIAIAAVANPIRDVYISKGIYGESVTMKDGVSLYGGYDAANGWQRSMSNVTRIQSPTTVGVLAHNLTQPVTIQFIDVVSADASGTASTGEGLSSQAVLIVNCAGGVLVQGCNVTAGAATSGTNGNNGANGSPGSNGGVAVATAAGAAGGSACAAGGAGAPGRSDTNNGYTGNPGTTAAGGGVGAAGGLGGQGGSCGTFSSHGGANAPAVAANGAPGAVGTNGGSAAAFGTVDSNGNYAPPDGVDGTSGGSGGGGGGGGSGGGSAGGTGFFCTNCQAFTSGGGGGGGGGGCGGGAGLGGHGGGGSFAITAINTAVTIDQSRMATRSGGNGGTGGSGGIGAGGGVGAAGGVGQTDSDCGNVHTGNGATGSNGGTGAHGGGGSGGTGGPSICIVFKGTTPNVTPSLPVCSLGSPGTGGTGGSDGSTSASNGSTGLAQVETGA